MKKSVVAVSMALFWSCNAKEKVVCNLESNITYSQHISPIIELIVLNAMPLMFIKQKPQEIRSLTMKV